MFPHHKYVSINLIELQVKMLDFPHESSLFDISAQYIEVVQYWISHPILN